MEPRTRLILVTFALTLALGVGSGWAIGRKTIARPAPVPEPARPTRPAPPVAQRPSLSPETAQLLTNLSSEDTATWREAAVRLSFTRPFPDEALEALRHTSAKPRVLEVLDGALANCLSLEEVRSTALRELLAPALTDARERMKDGLRVRLGALDVPPESGAVVAVALQALRSRDMEKVVRGLRALASARPACAKERVRALLANGSVGFDVDGEVVRVREVADEVLRELPAGTTPLAGLEAVLKSTPVFETAREVVPGAAKAESVDAWFELARPVWRAYWDAAQAADGGVPSDEAWRDRVNALLHFRETRRLQPRGRSLLHLTSRAPVSCEVATTAGVVAKARLPLDYEGDVPDDVVHLRCGTADEAPVLDRSFTFEPGDELTIEVLP
ncbi:MAG: hypothetical protein MUC96_00275 [Myxococcaceae bacterium]|jgi:hypothetical protein|nr:hypothetical protein [Myxococcaceae bacterium]